MSKTPRTDEAAIGFARLLIDKATPDNPQFKVTEIIPADFARQLERELSAQWRPIESAPKDGRHILVTDGESVWTAEFNEFRSPEYCWVSENGSGAGSDLVTHWQPLPPPPKGTI